VSRTRKWSLIKLAKYDIPLILSAIIKCHAPEMVFN